MYRKPLLIILIIVSAFSAKAQYIGLKGGLNFSEFNIKNDKLNDEKLRTGFHFGAFLQLPLSDGFALQPEVLYSTKGAKVKYSNGEDGFNGGVDYKVDYIDVPLLGVFKFGDLFEIHLGPYVGFTSKTKFESTGDLITRKEDFDKSFFKDLDYGLIGGAALNFGFINVGARYNFGLQNVQDSDFANIMIGNARNRNFQVYAAIRIGNYD